MFKSYYYLFCNYIVMNLIPNLDVVYELLYISHSCLIEVRLISDNLKSLSVHANLKICSGSVLIFSLMQLVSLLSFMSVNMKES